MPLVCEICRVFGTLSRCSRKHALNCLEWLKGGKFAITGATASHHRITSLSFSLHGSFFHASHLLSEPLENPVHGKPIPGKSMLLFIGCALTGVD